jgi:hypothetical protein
MKRKFSISVLFVMCMMMVLGVTSVFAAYDATTQKSISLTETDIKGMDVLFSDKAETEGFMKTDNKKLELEFKANSGNTNTGHAADIVTYGDKKLYFNQKNFTDATEKSKKEALGNFVRGLQKSTVSDQTQQKIFDDMSAADDNVSRMLIPLVMDSTTADLYTAMKWVSPFLPIVRLVFGIGAFCIFLFLMGSTIVDLAFIGLPIARESLQNKGEQKGGKIPFVSSDAMSVIKETESALDSSGGYKNAYLIYFKRRALTYIILSVCVLYLVVGELGGLIGWLLSLGSGVVG